MTDPRADVVPASSFTTRPVRWLWDRWIPAGKLGTHDGNPGLGKSHLEIEIIACLTTGRALPNDRPRDPCTVLLLSAEDDPADTIRPRLEAAGADLDRVQLWRGTTVDGAYLLPTLPADVDQLREIVDRYQVRYIPIDPIMAYLGIETNTHRDHDVRRALAPLADLGHETGAAIHVVRHLRKAASADAVTAGGGSIGIIGAARTGMLVAKDPDNPARRILAQVKNNVGPLAESLSFELVTTSSGWARIEWLGTSTHSADALVAASVDQEERGQLDEAKDVLREWLDGGPQPKADLMRRAKSLSITVRTLERAKTALGVTHQRAGFGPGSRVEWALPYSPYSPSTPKNGFPGEYVGSSRDKVVVEKDLDILAIPNPSNGEYGGNGTYSPPEHARAPLASMDPEADMRAALEGGA